MFAQGEGNTCQVQPLGLGYVGAAIAAEHDVRFLLPDTRSYTGDDPWGEIAAAIADEAPDVIGLTAVTADFPAAARFAELAKAVDPNMCVVLGGVHATTEPVAALEAAPSVDVVVQGDGESTMLELLRQLESGGVAGMRPDRIQGLVWRDARRGVTQSAPRPPVDDLDAIPFPLRDGLVWHDDIHPAFFQGMVTMRGCPYRCIYCAVPSSAERRVRFRSASSVVDEIQLLRDRYDVPALFFHDSVFTMRRSRTLAICDTMIERELLVPFYCQTRADRVDPELIARMRQAGCEQIFLGIESGSAESLRRIHKHVDLDTVRAAVEMVRGHDIRCAGFFIIGFPWETEQHVTATFDFATSLGLDAVSLFSATPLPGTKLWHITSGAAMPDSVDFRTPQVNLTTLSDDRYAALFTEIAGGFDAYNRAQMPAPTHDAGPATSVSWVD